MSVILWEKVPMPSSDLSLLGPNYAQSFPGVVHDLSGSGSPAHFRGYRLAAQAVRVTGSEWVRIGLMTKEIVRFIAACIVASVLVASPCLAADSVAALSSAFILNVIKFTPGLVGQSDNLPLTIAVVGSDSYRNDIKSFLQGKFVRTHPIQIEAGVPLGVTVAPVVIFSPEIPEDQLSPVLSTLKGPVLTFGSAEGFAQQGGIIEFHIIGDRVRFRVNRRAMRTAQIELSSRVLVLAEEVIQ